MRKYLQIIHVGMSQSLRPGLGCARQGTGVPGNRGATLLALPAGPRKSCPHAGGVWRAGVGHRPTLGLQPLPPRRRRPPWHSRLTVSVRLARGPPRGGRWGIPHVSRPHLALLGAPGAPGSPSAAQGRGTASFPFPSELLRSPPRCVSGEELCCGGAVVGEGGRRLSPRPWWRGGDCGGLGRD